MVPEGPEGRELSQVNPCPQAICPTGSGDERELHLHIDTTAAWGDPVTRMQRRLDSSQPLRFTLTDSVDLAHPAPVVLNLHSYCPISVDGNHAIFTGQHSQLVVTWQWPGEVVQCGIDLCDGEHVPVYHLAVRAPAAATHTLVTLFDLQ